MGGEAPPFIYGKFRQENQLQIYKNSLFINLFSTYLYGGVNFFYKLLTFIVAR